MILGKQDVTQEREITVVIPKKATKKAPQHYEVNFKVQEGQKYTDVVYLSESELHKALMDYFKKHEE